MKKEVETLLAKIFSTPDEKIGDPLVIEFCQQRGKRRSNFITREELLAYVESNLDKLDQCPPLFFLAIARHDFYNPSDALQGKLKELAREGNIGFLALCVVVASNKRGFLPVSSEIYKEPFTKLLADTESKTSMAVQYARVFWEPDNQNNVMILHSLVEQSYPPAQSMLGWKYDFGQEVEENKEKAVVLYKKAAAQGDARAQRYLGLMYELGLGVSQSHEEAVEFYKQSMAQGDAEAQANLALMYNWGRGVPQNTETAVELYKQSIVRGSAKARYDLGWMYERGRGVLQNIEKAVELYKESAAQGYAAAQCYLGEFYEEGQDVPQNIEKAVELYRESAAQGNAEAQANLGVIYAQGRGVAQNIEKAVELYKESAAQGNAAAQCYLGELYQKGQGVPQNIEKAVELYKESAAQGNANAQYNLGVMYALGQGVPQSDAEAVKLYQQSAAQGNANAQATLGWAYAQGLGVPQSDAEAVKFYEQSAAQGNANAQYYLGEMHEKGRGGLSKNLKKASYYIALAYVNKSFLMPGNDRENLLGKLVLNYIISGILVPECEMTASALLKQFKEQCSDDPLANTILISEEDYSLQNDTLFRNAYIETTFAGNTVLLHLLDPGCTVKGFLDRYSVADLNAISFGIHASTPDGVLEEIKPFGSYMVYPGVKIDVLAEKLGPVRFKRVLGLTPSIQRAIDFYSSLNVNEFEAQLQTAQAILASASSSLPQEIIDPILQQIHPELASCFSSGFWAKQVEQTRNGRLVAFEKRGIEQDQRLEVQRKQLAEQSKKIEALETRLKSLEPNSECELPKGQLTLCKFFKVAPSPSAQGKESSNKKRLHSATNAKNPQEQAPLKKRKREEEKLRRRR